MAHITLERLTKHYGDLAAVKNINLEIQQGHIFGLVGPSGCGKTTTLRMIAGLLDPDDGDIRFNGTSVLRVPPEKRRIGMVFQQYVLFPHMTVEENVAFGLRMQGMKRRQWLPKVNEVLELVQLSGYNARFPRRLSGGQQQRVAVARAVVIDPVVLLLDEPLSNLDTKLREEMREFLFTLQRRLNITTIFVTHDQTEAIELSDRMAVMFDGEIAQEDTPEAVFEHPVDRRVARFMGAANIIEGDVDRVVDGKVLVNTSAGRLAVTARGDVVARDAVVARGDVVARDAGAGDAGTGAGDSGDAGQVGRAGQTGGGGQVGGAGDSGGAGQVGGGGQTGDAGQVGRAARPARAPQPGTRVAVTVRAEHVEITAARDETGAAAGEARPAGPEDREPAAAGRGSTPSGSDEQEPAVWNIFTGTVEKAVFKGGLVHYRVSLGNDTIGVIERSDRRFLEGEQVRIRVAADKLWIFD